MIYHLLVINFKLLENMLKLIEFFFIISEEREENQAELTKLRREVEQLEFVKTRSEKQIKSLEEEIKEKIDELTTLKVSIIIEIYFVFNVCKKY